MDVAELDYDALFGYTKCKFTSEGFMFYVPAQGEVVFIPYNRIDFIRVSERLNSSASPSVMIHYSRPSEKGAPLRIDSYQNHGAYPHDEFIANAKLLLNRWTTYLVNGSQQTATIEQRLRDVETALLYAPPPAAGPEYHDAEDRFERNAKILE
jgi:hypothetical protein